MIFLKNKLGHGIKSSQSLLSSFMRGGLGMMGTPKPMQPEKPLVLYEFESCPFARRVREVMTHLNLDYESRPCPIGGHVYRDELLEQTGKGQIPYFVDQNTGKSMFESQAIIDYLFAHYSPDGVTADKFKKAGLGGVGVKNIVATTVSMMRGSKPTNALKNKQRGKPKQLLELYGFEASPFCRLVREQFSALELGYINHNVAREQLQDIGTANLRFNMGKYKPVKGGKRERIKNQVMNNKIQVPYFIDPNTNTEMFESRDIINYLHKTYT